MVNCTSVHDGAAASFQLRALAPGNTAVTGESVMRRSEPETLADDLVGVVRVGPRKKSRYEREEQRGYRLSYKQITLAFCIEIIIVVASLIGAWFFATKYATNGSADFYMMLLAPIGYAMVELSRVPLAIAARTQTSRTMKIVAIIAVFCAAGVTIKSMSQLGELMFRPRLAAVSDAKRHFVEAKNERAALDKKISEADAFVEQKKVELANEERRLLEVSTVLGKQPGGGQNCGQVSGVSNGQFFRDRKCKTNPAAAGLKIQLAAAQRDRGATSRSYDEANAARATFDRTATDKKAIDAETSYREAVFNSQLHSFTAMVFGKEPSDVTDGEIAQFLRIFVFVPAIFVSLAATLLAMTAVHRLPPKREEKPVMVADEAGAYLLGPLAEAMVKEAREAVERVAHGVMEEARATGRNAAEESLKAGEVVSPDANYEVENDKRFARERAGKTAKDVAPPSTRVAAV
jgi:hypothetical protein